MAEKAKGLPKRVGRKTGAGKRTRYWLKFEEKKIRRILRCNGPEKARAWAERRLGGPMVYRRLVEGKVA